MPLLAQSGLRMQFFPNLEWRSLPERRRERSLVEVIELSPDRHSVGKPGDLDLGAVEEIGDVVRGGLSIDSGIEREHELGDRRILSTRNKCIDREVLRADTIERRQGAAEHVVARIDGTGALERPEIRHIRDHDDDRRIAPWVGANGAGVATVNIPANFADLDLFQRGLDSRAQRRHDLLAFLDEKQRNPSRRAGPQSRQSREQLDQTLDFRAGRGRCHQPTVFRTASFRAATAASINDFNDLALLKVALEAELPPTCHRLAPPP